MTEANPSGDCPFCAVSAGRLPAHIVAETPRLLAVLDGDPIRPGHLQILPREHYPHFNALPVALARELLSLGERLAAVQRSVFRVDRVGFLFPAGAAAHAQVQAVPLLSAGDVAARRPAALRQPAFPTRPGPSDAELAALAVRLGDALLAAEGMGAMPWRPLPDSGVLVG